MKLMGSGSLAWGEGVPPFTCLEETQLPSAFTGARPVLGFNWRAFSSLGV